MIARVPFVRPCALLIGFCLLAAPQARADLDVTLSGVTFADGGTASGSFVLNVYGYIESADITTTPGTSLAAAPLAGYSYGTAGAGVANGPVFDTIFTFGSSVDNFELTLDTQQALTPGFSNYDRLVGGSGSGPTLAGSTEICQEGFPACGSNGPGYLDGRLITAGYLYAPEPASISLLGLGGALLVLRRRRQL